MSNNKIYAFIFAIVGLAVIIAIGLMWTQNRHNTDTANNNINVSKPSVINVGVHSRPGGGIVYIADKKGFFAKNNIVVNIQKIENFDAKRAALIGGSIDIDIANTLDQLLIYAENKIQARVIGITDQSVGGDGIVVTDNINSIEDLRGKRIAFAEASPSDFFLRYILNQNNISIDDIIPNPVADPQIAGNVIISKTVDAAVTYEPFLSQAGGVSGLKLLSTTKEYPTLIPGLMIADDARIQKNEGAYRAFLKAWFEAVDYYYDHPEESQNIIAEGMGMNSGDVKDILSVVAIQTQQDNKTFMDTKTNNNIYELVNKINIFWKKSGFIKTNFDANTLINNYLINEA